MYIPFPFPFPCSCKRLLAKLCPLFCPNQKPAIVPTIAITPRETPTPTPTAVVFELSDCTVAVVDEDGDGVGDVVLDVEEFELPFAFPGPGRMERRRSGILNPFF